MRVRVTEAGVNIPKKLLMGVAEVEIRKQNSIVVVVPKAKEDPLLKLGANPVVCGVPDASENLDDYLYAENP